MAINLIRARDTLHAFDFRALFTEELGWSQPASRRPFTLAVRGEQYGLRHVSELAGVVVLEVESLDGKIPDASARAAVQKEVSRQYHENVLIFVDPERTQSLWYWTKREGAKRFPREHLYAKGQPGDLFLSKIGAMFVDIGELDEQGNIPIVEVARRLQQALDVEPVTKKFYNQYREERLRFLELIQGIADEADRRWYASVLLNRLMFIYFLQAKYFLDGGDVRYLQRKLDDSKARGPDRYYEEFLKPLFFEGFAKPEEQRSEAARRLLGKIKYLNGGLFLEHPIEARWPSIAVPDVALENLLDLFARYSWNLDDTPGGRDDELNPDVLGYIFEKYINQKAFGAYYTRPEITEYLCEQTIHRLILDRVNAPAIPGVAPARHFESVPDLLMSLDADLCRTLLFDVLPKLSLLDPACGSGAFLVAAMKTLINVYSAVTGKIEYLHDRTLSDWLREARTDHPSLGYFIKKRIITDNLFGVDIMEEGTEIAKLRLFLALVSSAQTVDQLEPLPNIDFNILAGNSLIGLLRVDEAAYDAHGTTMPMFTKPYREVVAEKDRLIRGYRDAAGYAEDLRALRDDIQAHRTEARDHLDDLLLDDFKRLGIHYEQATWDAARSKEGRPKRRPLWIEDIQALHPFHWGYEFDEVLNQRGGFDAIITNPPWEAFKPQAKEFFAEYSSVVTTNKMTIKEFEREQVRLMQRPDVSAAWLEYRSRFPHQNTFYRSSPQYAHQAAVVDDKKDVTDLNFYKLFLEQCFNLLRPGGQCGIVIPSGIYTDLGTRGLRGLLFSQAAITGLFGFENRKVIFEGVHRSYKFVVLTFEKGGVTTTFPSAFMRLDVAELEDFPKRGALSISVDLVRRLSPGSLSVAEFKSELDLQIVEKMLQFPHLGADVAGAWQLRLGREFHMTDDRRLFREAPAPGLVPLFEGKMIHQFTHRWGPPRYWIDVNEGRRALLGGSADEGQVLPYQVHRLGFRRIARNTDERTMMATVMPRDVFVSESITLSVGHTLDSAQKLFVAALLNSFSLDYYLRQKVSANINMFYVYQLPVPRLTEKDAAFKPIIERAACLVCTTPGFDDLAKEVGLRGYEESATDPIERAHLRAELDGMVAHLYGLTEAEFSHILSTFPLVADPIKVAAQNAYRDVERGLLV